MTDACRRGHEFTPENTIQRADGRRCRTCRQAAAKRRIHPPSIYVPGTDTIHSLTPAQLARFWAKVDVRGPEECWPWTANREPKMGYGRWRAGCGTHNWVASRLSLSLHLGRDLGDSFALHRCDNPPCVNPAHLYEGTVHDNVRDKVSKMRHLWGERINHSKLTPEQVYEIRRLYDTGTPVPEIARRYDISTTNARRTGTRMHWKHLPEEGRVA